MNYIGSDKKGDHSRVPNEDLDEEKGKGEDTILSSTRRSAMKGEEFKKHQKLVNSKMPSHMPTVLFVILSMTMNPPKEGSSS